MIVETIKEHEDGSATITFDVEESEREAVMSAGLKFILYTAALGITTIEALDILEREVKIKNENAERLTRE